MNALMPAVRLEIVARTPELPELEADARVGPATAVL
jgi:hypothetical protein